MQFSWKHLPRPILALAPMSGYTDSAFRQMIKELAPAAVCFTEFISAESIIHGNRRSQEKFTFAASEQPLIVQIFGSRPVSLARAAEAITAAGAAGIDLNMGCPARKVLRSGSGASLVKDWTTAVNIVKAVKAATPLPVSVKTRIGWDSPSEALEFAHLLVVAGAEMLTIHGRVATQGHTGVVHWETIYRLKEQLLKEKLSVPILGNGGISCVADLQNKLGNLDGIMIGRAALANPWLFVRRDLVAVPWPERVAWYLHHAQRAVALKGEWGIVALRKHLIQYVSGLPTAKKLRIRLSQAKTVAEVAAALPDKLDILCYNNIGVNEKSRVQSVKAL